MLTMLVRTLSQLEYRVIARNRRWPEDLTFEVRVTIERHKTLEATWLNLSQNFLKKCMDIVIIENYFF